MKYNRRMSYPHVDNVQPYDRVETGQPTGPKPDPCTIRIMSIPCSQNTTFIVRVGLVLVCPGTILKLGVLLLLS